MTDQDLHQTESIEIMLRIISGSLTVGLLIVVPALKILGLA